MVEALEKALMFPIHFMDPERVDYPWSVRMRF